MNEHHNKIVKFCDKPFERNNYFFGKLMKVEDFEAEQNYFNKKRWLVSRAVHGWGVVCGLDVQLVDQPGNSDKVNITPGLAIDCYGREILVCEPQIVSLRPEDSGYGNEKQTEQNESKQTEQNESKQTEHCESMEYAICLKFKECKTEKLPILDACDQKESCQFNRIRDWFEIKVIPIQFLKLDRKPFCPRIDDCEGEKKSLHQCICERLKCCPDCHGHLCVVLATVTLNENFEIQDIDYSERKLVYNNPLLYDLISCYHGNLPRVCKISWHHDKLLEWHEFENIVSQGLRVTFNKRMRHETINTHTFKVVAITTDEMGGYHSFRYLPADNRKIKVHDEGNVTIAVFHFERGWKSDEVESEGHPAVHSIIAHGAEFEILLHGSSIFSIDGKALDGSFRGNLPSYKEENISHDKKADLPSGTGTQGSDFLSWFSVKPRHRHREEYEDEGEDTEENEQ